MHSSRRVFCKAAFLFTLTHFLSPASGQTVSANVSDFPGQQSGSKLAYYRWRTWLLSHPAVLQKVPPVTTPVSPSITGYLNIHVAVAPSSVLSVDDSGQTMTFSASLYFWWVDEALAVDSDQINTFTDGNVSLMPNSVTVPTSSLWMPPMILAEGVSALRILQVADEAEVTADGVISIFLVYILTVSCRFDMKDYPFDIHECSMTLTSSSSVAQVISTGPQWDKSLYNQFSVSGEWDLVGFMSTNSTLLPWNTLYSRFVMRIKRKTMFYVVVIILPMVLTSYLNVLVFLLPPDLGDKTSYLVTINISMSVFTSFFNQDMPRGLDTLPKIFRLLVFVLVESVISLVLSLIVLRKYKNEQAQQEAEAGTTFCGTSKKHGRVSPLPDKNEFKKESCKGRSVVVLSAKQMDLLFFVIVFTANTVGIIAILVPLA